MNKEINNSLKNQPSSPSLWTLGFTLILLALGTTMSAAVWLAKQGVASPLLDSLSQWLKQSLATSSDNLFSNFLSGAGMLGTGIELSSPNSMRNFIQSWGRALANLVTLGLLQKVWQNKTTKLNAPTPTNSLLPVIEPPAINQRDVNAKHELPEPSEETLNWSAQKTAAATTPSMRGYKASTVDEQENTNDYKAIAGYQA